MLQLEELYKDIAILMHHVWKGINFKDMGKSRLMGIYSEFEGKMTSSASTNSVDTFYSTLIKKMGSMPSANDSILDIIRKYRNASSAYAFLDNVRTNSNICMQYLKESLEENKINKK